MKNKVARCTRVAVFLFTTTLLVGCGPELLVLQALSAASLATSGFMAFKTVQLSTGGSASISFSDEDQDIPDAVRAAVERVQKPAVWPGNHAEVQLAQHLQQSRQFESVVTPSQVSKALKAMEVEPDIGALTQSEQLELFSSVAAQVGADAVIAGIEKGQATDMNMWSVSRANNTSTGDILIYSAHTDSIVYTTSLELKVEVGGKTPNEHEILSLVGDAIAERILAMRNPESDDT